MISIYDYQSYKPYLVASLDSRTGRGQRTRLAEFLRCKPAYVSLVLNGKAEFSPEQASRINSYLGHTPAEGRFFLNLVLLARAGTAELRAYYEEELRQQRASRLVLKNRVEANRVLGEADQARYYSSWHYAAVHVIVSLKGMSSGDRIAMALSLPLSTVNECLEFLVKIGVLVRSGQEYRQGEVSLYLGSDSPFITKHHTNWRVRALQSLDSIEDQDLHYSGVITCSKKDLPAVRETMVRAIEKIRSIVKESRDEKLFVYTMDLFGLLSGKPPS